MSGKPIPPGWYPAPDGADCRVYWDGLMWTNQTRPMIPSPHEQQMINIQQSSANSRYMNSIGLAIVIIIAVSFVLIVLSRA